MTGQLKGFWRRERDEAGILLLSFLVLSVLLTISVNADETGTDRDIGETTDMPSDTTETTEGGGITPGFECVENWECTDWGICTDGNHTRRCWDVNNCGTELLKPNEQRPCATQSRTVPEIQMPPFIIPEPETTNETIGELVIISNTSRTYETINTTQPALIEVEKPEISIRNIEINVKRNVSNVAINITRISRKPSEIVQNLTGPVYQYINITHENITDQDVENITISFDVNQSWIVQNSINKSRVFLSRYTVQWDKLPTRLVNETLERVYYEAVSPGLSIFAIFGESFAYAVNQTCIPMDRRCYGDVVQECNYYGTEWVTKEVCQYGCFDIKCSAELGSPEANWWLVITVIGIIILTLSGLMYYFEEKRKRKAEELAVSERLK